MSNDLPAEVLTPTAVASGVGVIIKVVYECWLRSKMRSSETAIVDTHEIYNILNTLIHEVNAIRCTISYTSNGGGIPSAGNNLYTTLLYEVTNGAESWRDVLQNVLADEGYIEMISTVIKDKYSSRSIESLTDGYVKEIKTKQGITHIQLCSTHKTKKRFYYLTVSWDIEEEKDRLTNLMHIKTANDKISRILQKSKSP